jgi:phage terminase large subunit
VIEWTKKRDPDKYAHIYLGEYEVRSEARVFRNWRIGSHADFDKYVPPGVEPGEGQLPIKRWYFGADWGYSIDPTVLIRCFIDGRKLFIDREVYYVGCEVDHLPFLFGGAQDEELIRLNKDAYEGLSEAKRAWKGIPDARKWPIRADSSKPDTISYLERHGFPRIVGAYKGAGSVDEGIEFLQSFDIIVHPDCTHTIDELTTYSYKVDPKTDEVIPVLADHNNHLIDALRYAVEGVRRAEPRVSMVGPILIGAS